MTKFYDAKIQLTDAKADKERRFRHILAASGKILESGEIRDIEHLYVMSRDGEPIPIHTLNPDPDKQTEEYTVKAQADHGEVKDGELVPSIEKQFGSCKVWLEDGQLHARMYFADNDTLADHAWAISGDASYSTGIDWYEDGYYGAGQEIDEPIGILREISMVLTGNDPRAKTIDTKTETGKGRDRAATTDGDNKSNFKKGKTMVKTVDQLTPDERAAMQREMGEAVNSIIDKFTTGAPESETEPTARDTKDEVNDAEEIKEEERKEIAAHDQTKDTLHMPVLVIKDRKEVAHQELDIKKTSDWRFSPEAKRKFADMLHANRGFDGSFKADWKAELKRHGATTNDGITGLGLPVDLKQIFETAIEGASGILQYVAHTDTRGIVAALTVPVDAKAKGHRIKDGKPDEKAENSYARKTRELYTHMIYSKLTLNAMEIYEHPEVIDFRAKELAEAIVRGEEQAIIIGNNFPAPASEDDPDYRWYDPETNRGFHSIKADAQDTTGYGQYVASTITAKAGENLFDVVTRARKQIRTPGKLFLVSKIGVVTDFQLAKDNEGRYLFTPGTEMDKVLRVVDIIEPQWMDEDEDFDAYLVVVNAYTTIGKNTIDTHPDFKTENNKNVLLDESPRGGALTKYKSAVAIKLNTAATTKD